LETLSPKKERVFFFLDVFNIFLNMNKQLNILVLLLIACSFSVSAQSLCGVFAKKYPIGAAVSSYMLKNPSIDSLLRLHFSSLTPDNEMKPEVTEPQEGIFRWEGADAIVNFAQQNHMKVRGHCLVWHQQTPNWFFEDHGKQASKKVLYEHMKEHIFAEVGRYKGKVYAWDVVNEAVSDNGKSIYRTESPWYKITGKDYIAQAFRYAHQADPKAVLFYNDYNVFMPEKRMKIYTMLKELLKEGVPVQGIGIQGHWSFYQPTEKELKETIQLFASLGLKVQITEMDVSAFHWEKNERKMKPGEQIVWNDSIANVQAARYAMFFRVFNEFPKVITGVTFWGVTDNYSWLNNYPVRGRKNYPLLFDKFYQEKPAFHAVIDSQR
jgi:endo-1,4-beta-xylanase